jgi:dipeptidase
MVAMSDVTDDGSIIFGKNSDRQVNEPLSIRYIPSSIHSANTKVQTTYIEIDQVEKTNSCILFCPGNVFGAEMGFNCHGLVIGNEALFTKISSDGLGLTGMDLVRLVLERCSTSLEGKTLIISLLNKYGQGGNCGFTSKFYYQNSFLLVDSNEGWIIETIGKDYAAKNIKKGIHTISNKISFGGINTFDEYSFNLISNAISNGWCHSIEDFHFEKCYSGLSLNPKEFYNGFIKTYFSSSKLRKNKSTNLINNKYKNFNVIDMFNVLRDHHCSKGNPINGLTNVDICMHASFGPIKFNQTTGSLVSILPKSNVNIPTHYVTCSSSTCLAIFKPIWLHSSFKPPIFLLSDQINSSLTYSTKNIWWKSEIINRNIQKYYQKLIQQIQIERNLLEKQFVSKAKQLSLTNFSHEERNHFTGLAFDQVKDFFV